MTRCTSEDSVTLDCFRSAGLPFNIIAILFFCFYFFGRPLRTENTVFHSTTGVTLHFFLFLHHFQIDHNAPCLLYPPPPPPLPQHFTYPLFQFLLGITYAQRKIKDNGFANFFFLLGVGGGGRGEGVNKVYYGLCGIGEYFYFFSPKISHLDPP